ncbi:MAG TPA: SpoIIE family protein phosphatase, partial [bacterium]|nr:SpoIIE family protein phosphatase [bacterium]
VAAGCPSPRRIRARLPVPTTLPLRGDPLGVFESPRFESRTFPIASGDRLFLNTDGLVRVQRRDPSTGRTMCIREDALDDLISGISNEPLDGVVGRIWDFVLDFCDDKPDDDMLLVGIEIP